MASCPQCEITCLLSVGSEGAAFTGVVTDCLKRHCKARVTFSAVSIIGYRSLSQLVHSLRDVFTLSARRAEEGCRGGRCSADPAPLAI